jgi:hypothetical protein
MKDRSENIFRIKALLILVVFGISLLPRQVLHNFVTNHKHTKYAGYPGKAQVAAETFNCSTDTIFLQHTYHITEQWQQTSPATELSPFVCRIISDVHTSVASQCSLRGPPFEA